LFLWLLLPPIPSKPSPLLLSFDSIYCGCVA
jgi:hypothetical protein